MESSGAGGAHPVLDPGSPAWRHGSDVRALLAAGRALVLQVAHPTVAAGVRDHSTYRTDPWGRLERTLDSLYTLLYSPGAAAEGARLRTLHRRIRGLTPEGRRYHALEPEAYAWVHATIVETIAMSQAWGARPLRGERLDRYYAEMRGIGRLLGLRDRDLPPTWTGFVEYVDGVVRNRLEDSDVVQDVVDSIVRPARPPLLPVPDRLWALSRRPVGHLLRLGTVGLLPALLRERLHLRWTAADDLELRALGAALRTGDPVMPDRLRVVGPAWLEARSRRGRPSPAAA